MTLVTLYLIVFSYCCVRSVCFFSEEVLKGNSSPLPCSPPVFTCWNIWNYNYYSGFRCFFLHPYTWEMIQFWRAYFAAMNPSDASPFRHMSIPSNLKRIKRKPWELKKPFMKDVFFWKDYDFSGLFYRSLTYRVHVGVPFPCSAFWWDCF